MKYLVTGAVGRLGREVLRILRIEGHEVRAFDLPDVPWEIVKDIEGVEVFLGDVTQAHMVSQACEKVDAVIHLAALLPPRSEADRKLTLKVNVDGTRNIISTLNQMSGIPLIFASSISTYGSTAMEEPPIREDHFLHAHNIYSESKIEAERLIMASDIPHVIFRLAPIAVANLVELPEVIPYRADQRVEFVCVEDVGRAIIAATENADARDRTFNIASGSSWQMRGGEYIDAFYSALGVEVDPVFSDEYTAIDWYDTSRSAILDYQRVTFDKFLEKLQRVAIELGLI